MRLCNLLDNRQSHPSTRNVTRPGPAINSNSRDVAFSGIVESELRTEISTEPLPVAAIRMVDVGGEYLTALSSNWRSAGVEQITVHVDQKIIRNLPDDGVAIKRDSSARNVDPTRSASR